MNTIKICFRPQTWINDYAVDRDDRDAHTCYIPADAVKGIKPCTYEADELRNRDDVPKWWGEWDGPFEIEWVEEDDEKDI